MRIKAFFIYIGLGIAFLAVSLWVFLSGGKNAKAIRAKYKLGGMMLSTWAIVSAAACSGPGPFVTCYDAVDPESQKTQDPPPEVMCYDPAPSDMVHMDSSTIVRGQELKLFIDSPNYESYLVRFQSGETVLQEERVPVPEELNSYTFEFTIIPSEDLPEGDARLVVLGIFMDSDAEEAFAEICNYPITIE